MTSPKKRGSKRTPRLSPSQTTSPATLPPDELVLLRAELEAEQAEQNRRRGHELLAAGARLLSQQRPGEAVEVLSQAAHLLPDDVDVAINLGGAYILQHRYRQAVPILERASQLAPDNAMVWMNLAAAYLGRLETSGPEQQRQAIAAYERALALHPEAPHVHYNLGLIYKDQRAWEQASAHFRNALAINPADADARYWLDKVANIEQQAASAAATTLDGDAPHDHAEES